MRVGVSRVQSGAHVGACNDLLSIISKDKVGEYIALSFGNANPSTTFLTTVRRINGVGLVEDRFPPMKLEKRRDISLDASSIFNGSQVSKSLRGHVVKEEDHIK